MKSKILSYLSLGIKFTSIIAGLSSYVGWIPSKYLPACVLVFAVASNTKDFFIHLQTDFSQGAVPVQQDETKGNK